MNTKLRTVNSLFGMAFDSVSLDQAANVVLGLSTSNSSHLVVTPNVDHFLRWQKSHEFRKVYERASLRVLDGMPLVWLARRIADKKTTRVTGVDLLLSVFSKCEGTGVSIAFVGGSETALSKARDNLMAQFPHLDIYLVDSPTAEDLENTDYVKSLAVKISSKNSKVVALCLGSPKQENLFLRLQEEKVSGVMIGAGASVDFFAGRFARAPKIMRNLGMEWLFRVAQEPRRLFKRYAAGALKFTPYVVFALFAKNANSPGQGKKES